MTGTCRSLLEVAGGKRRLPNWNWFSSIEKSSKWTWEHGRTAAAGCPAGKKLASIFGWKLSVGPLHAPGEVQSFPYMADRLLNRDNAALALSVFPREAYERYKW